MDEAQLFGRNNLIAYAIGTMPAYETPPHVELIGQKLESLERRGIKRLMVFMPPRHGKSFLISQFFPTWYLGRNPEHEIIFTSYSQEVASGFGRKIRNMMAEPIYQYFFPGTEISDDSSAVNRFNTNRGGALYAVGAGGPLTSRGANLIIIDDIHKNRQEASSAVIRKRIHEWWGSTLYTRLMPGGTIVLVQTRWHEDDLPGRILDEKAEEWEVLSLPALSEAGDALWPERYPVDRLMSIKSTIGTRDFDALYQQTPTPDTGNIFKRDWWKFYKVLPSDIGKMIQSWDLTFTEGESTDYVSGQVWAKRGADKYLIDQFRARAGFNGQIQAIRGLSAKHPKATGKHVEKSANAYALLEVLRKEIPGMILVPVHGSKIARAESISPQVEAGNIYLPDPSIAPWIHDFIEEHAVFPLGTNDDQVDAASQAISVLSQNSMLDISTISMIGESRWK